MPRTRSALILALGDAVILLGFVLSGMRTHNTLEQGDALTHFLALAGPLLVLWPSTAVALGAWPGHFPGWQPLLGRALAAWLIAAPLALILRALLLGSATLAVPFVLVTLGLGGVLLLAWRGLFFALARRR